MLRLKFKRCPYHENLEGRQNPIHLQQETEEEALPLSLIVE